LRAHMPDLLLLDFVLPDGDGATLVKELRAAPGGATLPILAMTGFLSRIEEARAAAAGFDDYLLKPVEPSRLVRAVRRFLGARHRSAPSGSAGRLVIADDEPVQRKLLATRLHLAGF